jgi:hypothetical protein
MTLTSAKRRDGACDQCQRFLRAASKGIGAAEGRGSVCPVSAVSRISKGSRTKQMRDRGIELS